MKNTIKTIAMISMLASAGAAFSHISLEQGKAPAGSSYRAVFRVSHGCDGLPTTGITVQMPEGVQGSKPMPKPGWALAVRKEKLANPYPSHGKQITDDVTEITWTANSPEAALPDAHYDEFVLRATLPEAPGPVWFKVIQTCSEGQRQGRMEWVQIPTEGVSTRGLKAPAVLLQAEPADTGHAHH